MKPTRSLQRILVIGETHFVGKRLIIQFLKEHQDVEIWVEESAMFNDISKQINRKIHFLEVSNEKNLLEAWQIYSWDIILHLVSNYGENDAEYKIQLANQKSFIGGAVSKLVETTNLKPLYVEIESDWVFSKSVSRELEAEVVENNILYLENYAHRICIETTNILSKDMQPNHWVLSFIASLKSKKKFGVPYGGAILRDWIALEDYVEAIINILKKGSVGEDYTVIGFNEWTNYDLMLLIGATYDRLEIRENGAFKTQLCNEKIVCRSSYKETKMGVSYIALDDLYSPRSIYDVIEQLVTKV